MLNIVMPMAGDGQRYKDKGYSTLKPLIDVCGKPMFMHSLNSLPLDQIRIQVYFIIKKIDDENHHFSKHLKESFPKGQVHILPNATRGAVETIHSIVEKIPSDQAVLILDSDLIFKSTPFNDYLIENNYDKSAVVYFESNNRHFSYAQLDASNRVKKTAEKDPISQHALAGAYFFQNQSILLKAIKKSITSAGEYKFYISSLYNYLTAEDYPIQAYPLQIYHSLGTPQELELYLSNLNH